MEPVYLKDLVFDSVLEIEIFNLGKNKCKRTILVGENHIYLQVTNCSYKAKEGVLSCDICKERYEAAIKFNTFYKGGNVLLCENPSLSIENIKPLKISWLKQWEVKILLIERNKPTWQEDLLSIGLNFSE